MSPQLSTCSDSSARHLSIIKEVAKTKTPDANSIAFNDLKQDYKDAIQCIISLEKHVVNLEDRIIQMSLELASAKASEDLINLKEQRSRRRSTSDVATSPPPDPSLLVSWQGVDEIDDIMSASDDDDADSEGCPAPPSPLPAPQKSNKKMLRRASVAICAPAQPPSLPKFGARRRTTTDISHHHGQKGRLLHRVSWPGVDEADTNDEDEECTSPPPTAQPHKQPPIKKLFRRCSLSMGDHHVEVDIVPKANTNRRQTYTKSLSGRRIVVENTDEPSDISDSFVPRSNSHLNNTCRDNDVSNSRHHLDESASSSKGFDLRQLFAKQKQQGRNNNSYDTDEEKCCDSPISTNKNKIDTSHSSRNRGGCGADEGLDESSSSRLFGQLFQRKNSRRASNATATVKKEEVDTRGDINRRIAFHKERAALLNDESDRFLA